MSEPTDQEQTSETKPWWKRWWGIALIVLGIFMIFGALTPDTEEGADPTATPSPTATATVPASPTATTSAIPEEAVSGETAPETAEPSPEPAAEPTPEQAFEPFTLEGSGDDVVTLDGLPSGEFAIARLTHQGNANFVVNAFGPETSDDFGDLLVNTIGSYQGVRPLNFPSQASQQMNELQIQADGSWTVEIAPLADAQQITDGSAEGPGDQVLIAPDTISGATELTHDGSSNFVVEAYNPDWNLVANEIGPYDATVRMPSGTLVIVIQADGNWTLQSR